jgi:hypothetical protein
MAGGGRIVLPGFAAELQPSGAFAEFEPIGMAPRVVATSGPADYQLTATAAMP